MLGQIQLSTKVGGIFAGLAAAALVLTARMMGNLDGGGVLLAFGVLFLFTVATPLALLLFLVGMIHKDKLAVLGFAAVSVMAMAAYFSAASSGHH